MAYMRDASGKRLDTIEVAQRADIAAEVAAQPTVVNAAASAVSTELAKAGTFTGVIETDSLNDIGLAFTDQAGNIGVWNAMTKDGGPIPEAIEIINGLIATANGGTWTITETLGYSFVILDPQGYIGLAVLDDGTLDFVPSDAVLDTLTTSVAASIETGPAEQFIPNPGDAPIDLAPNTRNHAGDSLTASGHIRNRMNVLLGGTSYLSAVGGENSLGIAARLNAAPYLMRPVDSAGTSLSNWPASGSVDVVLSTSVPGGSWPLLQGAGGGTTGKLAGVDWTFSIRVKDPAVAYPSHGAGDIYQLTRTVAGAAIPYKAPVPFLYHWGLERRKDIQIIGIGQNGSGVSSSFEASGDAATVMLTRAIIGNLYSAQPRYILWTQTGVSNTGITALETLFMKEWGRHFCNVRRFLIDEAFAYAGVSPDVDNQTDISAGTVPRYFRTDGVHHTQLAQELIAEFLFIPRMKELGYV